MMQDIARHFAIRLLFTLDAILVVYIYVALTPLWRY